VQLPVSNRKIIAKMGVARIADVLEVGCNAIITYTLEVYTPEGKLMQTQRLRDLSPNSILQGRRPM